MTARTIVREWWDYHMNLAMLFRHLVDTDQINPADVDEIEYFLSKPHKWQREWDEFTADHRVRHGY